MQLVGALLALAPLVAAVDLCGQQPAGSVVDYALPSGDDFTITGSNGAYLNSDPFWDGTHVSAYAFSTAKSWHVEKVGKKLAISKAGLFLVQCSGVSCPVGQTNSITLVSTTAADPAAQWTCLVDASGNLALQGNDGNLMTICADCPDSPLDRPGMAVISRRFAALDHRFDVASA
uniref:Secreted protein n=1 Tax=Achlya hypogyna TaxID=1202772 RepID=A0A0A7CP28_ACHHY|nr:secreted protein [Achlya hypogyna]